MGPLKFSKFLNALAISDTQIEFRPHYFSRILSVFRDWCVLKIKLDLRLVCRFMDIMENLSTVETVRKLFFSWRTKTWRADVQETQQVFWIFLCLLWLIFIFVLFTNNLNLATITPKNCSLRKIVFWRLYLVGTYKW